MLHIAPTVLHIAPMWSPSVTSMMSGELVIHEVTLVWTSPLRMVKPEFSTFGSLGFHGCLQPALSATGGVGH